MNVLLVGGGGREHALAWKLVQSPLLTNLYAAPGNPGIAALPKCHCIDPDASDIARLLAAAEELAIDLVVVGPEAPLAAGLADQLMHQGIRVFGPPRHAAQLESSKAFAKEFMARHGIPTAPYRAFTSAEAAMTYAEQQSYPLVVKADGLAAGKGVVVAHDGDTAVRAIQNMMVDRKFGSAGDVVVIESFLPGEEASYLAFCDGQHVLAMASSQDHKALLAGDLGPNTGGMGAYSPTPLMTDSLDRTVTETILEPTLAGLLADSIHYCGILYVGLMITETGPYVVEYNVRFGDPEAQVVLPRVQSDLLAIILHCCDGTLDQASLDYDPRWCATVVAASDGYPGAYPKGLAIYGTEIAEALPDVIVFHAGTARKDDQLVTNGGRVLDVTALGTSLQETLERAYRALDAISFEGMQFRRDIGAKAQQRLRAPQA